MLKISTRIDRAEPRSQACRKISEALGVPEVLAAILMQRGYDTPEKADGFINAEKERLHSPFLMRGMDAAARRVERAINNKETIMVYGDYDADGVTSLALMITYLRSRGAEPLYHAPDRFTEGYGMSKDVIGKLPAGGGLIITVDTGSKAHDEIAFAAQLGYETVVTDHHECPDVLPDCVSVVNPMRRDCPYPFKGLAGVGVAFKLIHAVETLREGSEEKCLISLCDEYADLVAIGTIADVMPLTDENRVFVKAGLAQINACSRPAIDALLSAARRQKGRTGSVNVSAVGFQIAPRINAAGRMANAGYALELLLTDSAMRRDVLADELCRMNEDRQRTENAIYEEALKKLYASDQNDRVLVLEGDKWHEGVIGIAASRICERSGKPTILVSVNGDTAKGSGRSCPGIDLNALLGKCEPLLIRYGGHELAAGLLLKTSDIGPFRKRINEVCPALPQESAAYTADYELTPLEANLPLAQSLSLLEPCGSGNEEPLFYMRSLRIDSAFSLSDGKHVKLTLSREGVQFTALCFGTPASMFRFAVGERIDLLFRLSVNDYQNRQSLQFITVEADATADSAEKYNEIFDVFEKARGGAGKPGAGDLPDRRDFKNIYLLLKRLASENKRNASLIYIAASVETPLIRLLYCLDALKELGLLQYTFGDESRRTIRFDLPAATGKVDLFSASIFRM